MLRLLTQFLITFTLFATTVAAQTEIVVENGSFESNETGRHSIPKGWFSFSEGDDFDLLPAKNVTDSDPQDGNSFIGLWIGARKADQGLAQNLADFLEIDSFYKINIWLSHAEQYNVPKLKNGKQNGTRHCNGAASFRLLGINSAKKQSEVLVTTGSITNKEWKEYSLTFSPRLIECDQIVLMAYYEGTTIWFNGNVLVDNCSNIKPISPTKYSDSQVDEISSNPDEIILKNPSFDLDKPRSSIPPTGWRHEGEMVDTPVDVQPGFWDCTLPAIAGCCYVGMVVRDNNTREGISQLLSTPLQKGAVYRFNLWANQSDTYVSASPGSKFQGVGFHCPVILKIWSRNSKNEATELLAVSQAIEKQQWMNYEFLLRPTLEDFDEILITVDCAPGYEGKNGHVLIDNCSSIKKI